MILIDSMIIGGIRFCLDQVITAVDQELNDDSALRVSIVYTLLRDRMTQTAHASLAAQVTPFNPALQLPAVRQMWNIHSTAGLAALNQEVTRQAAMIAYIDDFKLMMIVSLAAMPLLLLLRRPARHAAEATGAIE